MKRSKLTLLLLVLVLIVAGIVWRLSSASSEAGPVRIEAAELVLTKAWNGEVVRVPGALRIPQSMEETKEYRLVLRKGFVSDLTAADLDGNTYVAHALGREKNSKGENSVTFSSMEKRRPDGSLENVTILGVDKEIGRASGRERV